MSDLAGKVALVTGASKGIGAGIAEGLAAAGAAVAVNYASSKADADAVVARIAAAGGQAFAVQGDVSDTREAKAIVAATVERFGRLDVLVNNAGIYQFASIGESTEDLYRRIFDINVLGVLLVTQAALPHLGEGASVINISSGATRIHPADTAIYTGSKGAVDAITGVLANELGPRGIRVNAVSPGIVVTEGTHTAGIVDSEFFGGIVAQTPLGRAGQPEDIAGAVTFLASDAGRWLTGENLLASGGLR